MKNLVILLVIGLFLLCSCNSKESDSVNDTKRTDSLLKIINSPELAVLNKKILDSPDDANLYNERAKIYLKYRQLEDAINDAKRSLRIDSTNATYYLTEADVFFAANETRNAKEVLDKVVKKFPENTDGLLKLGELYYFVKQYENAFSKINQALKVNENLAKAYYLKGNIYKEIGDTAKAISSLETAIEQDNTNYGVFLDLGLIYAAKKNTLAFEYYDNAIKLNPLNSEALYAKAKLYQDLDQMNDAELLYNRILKNDSLHTFSLYNLGAITFGIHKEPQKALDYFSKAIEADPKYAEAYFARGVCYQELNDKSKAVADYKMCLKLKPNYEPAVLSLNSLGK
jgi:tetratricopeptide (TPR) repeat protein